MLQTYILFILGFVLLVKGADLLVEGAIGLAKKIKVSTLIIGLTIVAIGTSLPELLINIFAAIKGAPQISMGNIIGSNLFNILVILGVASLIYRIRIKSMIVWREIPYNFIAVIVFMILINNYFFNSTNTSSIGRVDAFILIAFLIIFFYFVFIQEKRKRKEIKLIKKELDTKDMSNLQITSYILLGMVGLYFGAEWVVKNAIIIAENLGISQYVISATIVALGTSLPEFVTAIVAMYKKEADIVVGNIIGSNLFNLLFVLPVTALIMPLSVTPSINFDVILLLIASTMLFMFMMTGKKKVIDRWEGCLFILLYVLYIVYLIYKNTMFI